MVNLDFFDEIYLFRKYVDFRKSINGLAAIVEGEMNLSLFNRYLFIFCNRKRDKLKSLYWDRTGFALWYKRLEQDHFSWPFHYSEDRIMLDKEKVDLLLKGFDIWNYRPHETLSYEFYN